MGIIPFLPLIYLSLITASGISLPAVFGICNISYRQYLPASIEKMSDECRYVA
jgi:hypothetical protein